MGVIKCEYCDRYNDNSLRDCPSCDAPINYNPQIEYHEIKKYIVRPIKNCITSSKNFNAYKERID